MEARRRSSWQRAGEHDEISRAGFFHEGRAKIRQLLLGNGAGILDQFTNRAGLTVQDRSTSPRWGDGLDPADRNLHRLKFAIHVLAIRATNHGKNASFSPQPSQRDPHIEYLSRRTPRNMRGPIHFSRREVVQRVDLLPRRCKSCGENHVAESDYFKVGGIATQCAARKIPNDASTVYPSGTAPAASTVVASSSSISKELFMSNTNSKNRTMFNRRQALLVSAAG